MWPGCCQKKGLGTSLVGQRGDVSWRCHPEIMRVSLTTGSKTGGSGKSQGERGSSYPGQRLSLGGGQQPEPEPNPTHGPSPTPPRPRPRATARQRGGAPLHCPQRECPPCTWSWAGPAYVTTSCNQRAWDASTRNIPARSGFETRRHATFHTG